MVNRLARLRRLIGTPHDAALFFRIGWFLFVAPVRLRHQDVREFVRGLRSGRRPLGSQETVLRMSGCWLFRCFPSRNTCYMRSMTLYRFLDAPSRQLRLHLGIERRSNLAERLRGHAWVSLGGRIIYGPPIAFEGRVREIALDRV